MQNFIMIDVVRSYFNTSVAEIMEELRKEENKDNIELNEKLKKLLEGRDRAYNQDFEFIEKTYWDIKNK